MTEIRKATPDEAAEITVAQEGMETTVLLVIEDGEIRGHLCLSRALGQTFGHDTRVWSTDPHAATKLWFAARTLIRSWGVSDVLVHFESEEDPMQEFWIRRGFKPFMTIYKGRV